MGSPISTGSTFQTPGVAEAEFENDLVRTFRTLLGPRGFSDPAEATFIKPGKGFLGDATGDRTLPSWLTEADIAVFVEAYRKSGFRGGLNWYRNIDRNWELTAPWHGAQIHQPSLFIAGSQDAVIRGLIGAKRVNELEVVLPNLKGQIDHRGRRPLGAAGAPRRGQCGADRFPEGKRRMIRKSVKRFSLATNAERVCAEIMRRQEASTARGR